MNDSTVLRLAAAIENFSNNVDKKLDAQAAKVDEILSKQYTVSHEPKIELPFEAEYEYVSGSLNSTFADKGGIDKLAHIFFSGYLPNGKTIRVNNKDSKFDSVYVNGTKLTENYTCRAEEGGIEKLNIMVVQQSDGKLSIDYADFPLNDFKMIVYDDLDNSVHPNIDSFIAGCQIDTLKYIGDMIWTCSDISTLKSLTVTGTIDVRADMHLICLQEYIVPNTISMPNINVGCYAKPCLRKLDIRNCSGRIAYLMHANLNCDLEIDGSYISDDAFNAAVLKEVRIGNACTDIGQHAFDSSTTTRLIVGANVMTVGAYCVANATNLTELIFNTVNALSLPYMMVRGCVNLRTIKLPIMSSMNSEALRESGIINVSFVRDNSISCQMYFQYFSNLTEQSCLNIVNAVNPGKSVKVSLHTIPKNSMKNDWYCKLEGNKYVSCESTDEGAITQESALTAKGGSLV